MAPLEKKPTKSFDDDLKTKKNFFKRIFPGFKKKATELSVLCGNSVGFICYGPDNDLHVWPEPHENPEALPQIVAKFNAMSDEKRTIHACDLHDFPNLKGSSRDELRILLSNLHSHLLGVRRQKMAILRKTTLKGSSDMVSKDQIRRNKLSIMRESNPNLKETLEEGFSDKDLMFSDNATISNRKASSSEDPFGFGGEFDELGYVVRGSQETVSNFGSCAASKVSGDVGVSDSSPLNPFTLEFSGGDYFPADPTPVTYNSGVCANDGVWDPSWMNLEFPSTLFANDWRVSGYDPLLGATDSLMASTYQTPVTDNLGACSRL